MGSGGKNVSLGIAWMAMAVLFFAMVDTTAKHLSATVAGVVLVFGRYVGSTLTTGAVALVQARRGRKVFASTVRKWQVARSLVLLLATGANLFAITYLPLTVTVSIMFTTPLFVTLLSMPLLGEEVGPRRIAAALVGLFGVLLITEPWSAGLHGEMGLSLFAAFANAFFVLLTKRMAGRDDHLTTAFHTSLWATVVLLPILIPFPVTS